MDSVLRVYGTALDVHRLKTATTIKPYRIDDISVKRFRTNCLHYSVTKGSEASFSDTLASIASFIDKFSKDLTTITAFPNVEGICIDISVPFTDDSMSKNCEISYQYLDRFSKFNLSLILSVYRTQEAEKNNQSID